MAQDLRRREPETAAAEAKVAAWRHRFGGRLRVARLEVDRHCYLDPLDGCCLHRWRQGQDLVRYLPTRATDLVHERCGCRRRPLLSMRMGGGHARMDGWVVRRQGIEPRTY